MTHQVALVLPLADHIICLDGQGSIAASGTPAQISTQLNNYMVRNTSSTSLATLAARAGNMSNNDLRRSSNSSIGTALTDVDDDAVTDADDSPPPLKPGLQTSKQNITDSSNQAPSQIKATKHRFFELIVSLNLNSALTKIDADCDSKADDSYEIDSMLAAPETIIVSETALSRRVMSMLVDKESKSTGGVGLSVYWFYLHATGGVLAGCTLILANLSVSVSWFYNSYTLGEWMQSIQQKDSARQQQFQLSEYIVSVCICLFVVTFLRMFQAFSALKASRDIHDKLLDNILTATLSWHDSQPSGRKVNRFSQDIATLDSTVMNNLQDFLDCFMSTIQVVIVISVLVPIMIPFLLPVVLYNYIVSKKYIKVSRELKRLESVSKSPIFVLFSETLTGLPVVRAFRHEKRFFNLACEYVDVMNRCHLYMWISNRWLNFRTQCMGACVSGCVAWFVVHQADNIGSTVAGLVLLNAMNFTDAITYMTRMHGECQMSMNSVERIAEYCDVEKELYEPEPTLNSNSINRALKKNHKTSKSKNGYATIHATDDDEETGVRSLVTEDSLTDSTELEMVDISAAWPEQGSITFDNIQLSYKPNDPPVLKGVSFEIPSGSKVGVVGRSGAGKSSLIAALFRTVEPTGGALRISNSNVLRMPLKTIRKCLAIVPQEPVLFRGTMKSNMDPFLERTDEDIWLALKKVHMDEHVANMPGSCGSPSGPLDGIIVAERGNNFSLGQRQLLCMARALLRKSKILILDEATASVDAETDSLIQETVRRELHDMTVLSIAHRLHTIAFYDKVIVMDRGSVAEFDTPYNLLNKKDSIFYSMCERSGDLEVIYKIAKAKYMEKGI